MIKKIFSVLYVLTMSMLLSHTSSASEIAQEDFDFFLEESYGRYWDEDEEQDIEDLLFSIALQAGTIEDTIDVFAAAKRLSEGDATNYALAIIEAVKYRENCNRGRVSEACAFEPGTDIYDSLIHTGFDDSSGDIAFIIAKYLPDYGPIALEAKSTFIDAVSTHPARAEIFNSVFEYDRDNIWMAVLIALEPADFERSVLFFDVIQSFSNSDESRWSGSLMTLLEFARQKSPDNLDSYVVLTQSLMSLQLQLGLHNDAVRVYRRLPAKYKEKFFSAGADLKEDETREEYFQNLRSLLIDQIAANILIGNTDEANYLFKQIQDLGIFKSLSSTLSVKQQIQLLVELQTPLLTSDNIYDYFIHGRTSADPELEQNDSDNSRFRGGDGWLFALSGKSPAFQRVVASYLEDANYFDMSNYLIGGSLYYRYEGAEDQVFPFLPLLPKRFEAKQKRWAAKIDAAWNKRETINEMKAKTQYESFLSSSSTPIVFRERKLPLELITDQNQKKVDRPSIPSDMVLPVESFQLVRYANESGEHIIIYSSGEYDSPGEIPAYGYWLQTTQGGGSDWQPPAYLGLQSYFPYSIAPHSRLPITGTDGKYTIEVSVREIDPNSISFPPVGLEILREESNLYLEFDIAALTNDQDEDGLPDLVENRIGLSVSKSDTDGDTIPDGIDSLPLTPYDASTPSSEKELAFAILSEMVGYERGAIVVDPRSAGEETSLEDIVKSAFEQQRPIGAGAVFLVADPQLFRGIRVPMRLLVYTPSDIEKLSTGSAPFYPAQISHIFADHQKPQWYIIWSASWVGGEFIVRCDGEKCETEVLSSWIT